MHEEVQRKTETCDSCGTMFRFEEIMDLASVIAPYLRVTDEYDSYIRLRISKMGKFVL